MDAQTDFAITIDRAAGLLCDATCATRAASTRPLPALKRRTVRRAIVHLERAQDILFQAANDPWQPSRKPRQPPL